MNNDIGRIDNIPAYALDKYIDVWKGKCMLIDVRDNDKYKLKHIEGSINIYYKEILSGNHQLPKDIIIILYCDRGGLSMIVARYLSQKGYITKNVVGGLKNYRGKKMYRI